MRRFLIACGILGALRVAAPIGLRMWVNHSLGTSQNGGGSIEDLDLNLWRGAYEIEGLVLEARGTDGGADASSREPMLDCRRVDLSIEWGALLKGEWVAEVVLHHPLFHWRAPAAGGAADEPAGTEGERGWLMRIDALVPLRIDRFVVRDGEFRYLDDSLDPPVDLYVTDLYAEMLDLSNVRDEEGKPRWAELELAGRPFGTGELEARMRLDPLAPMPTFELDFEVREIRVPDLNDALAAYANVDAEAGVFELYAEFAAAEGRVEGYVKPIFQGLEIVRFNEIDDPGDALEALWEGLVDIAAEVLENQPHDRLATRIPLAGRFGGANTNPVEAFVALLQNAFVAALRPAIDSSVELGDLGVSPARVKD